MSEQTGETSLSTQPESQTFDAGASSHYLSLAADFIERYLVENKIDIKNSTSTKAVLDELKRQSGLLYEISQKSFSAEKEEKEVGNMVLQRGPHHTKNMIIAALGFIRVVAKFDRDERGPWPKDEFLKIEEAREHGLVQGGLLNEKNFQSLAAGMNATAAYLGEAMGVALTSTVSFPPPKASGALLNIRNIKDSFAIKSAHVLTLHGVNPEQDRIIRYRQESIAEGRKAATNYEASATTQPELESAYGFVQTCIERGQKRGRAR